MLKGSYGISDLPGDKPQSPYSEVGLQAMDAILVELYGVQSTSRKKTTQKRQEPRRRVTPPLPFREYRERHTSQDAKGGCFVCYR